MESFAAGFFIASLLSFILYNLLEERKNFLRDLREKKPLIIGGIYRMKNRDDPFQTAATVRVIDIQRGADGKSYVQYVFYNGNGSTFSDDEKSFRDIYPLHLK